MFTKKEIIKDLTGEEKTRCIPAQKQIVNRWMTTQWQTIKCCPGIRTFIAVLNHFKTGPNTERKRTVILETVVNISMNRIMVALACAQCIVLDGCLISV